MMTIDWDWETGWQSPQLSPFQDFYLHPFSTAIHYGVQCYEGIKALKSEKGEIRLFRPELHSSRLKKSSKRICMPEFDETELV